VFISSLSLSISSLDLPLPFQLIMHRELTRLPSIMGALFHFPFHSSPCIRCSSLFSPSFSPFGVRLSSSVNRIVPTFFILSFAIRFYLYHSVTLLPSRAAASTFLTHIILLCLHFVPLYLCFVPSFLFPLASLFVFYPVRASASSLLLLCFYFRPYCADVELTSFVHSILASQRRQRPR
jgi:hypothetical protein